MLHQQQQPGQAGQYPGVDPVAAFLDNARASLRAKNSPLAHALAVDLGARDWQLPRFMSSLRALHVDVVPDEPPAQSAPNLTETELLEMAYGQAARHSNEFLPDRWQQISHLYEATRAVWDSARAAVHAWGADFAEDVRWHGPVRTIGIRGGETIARLSFWLADHLSPDSTAHRALQNLGSTARQFATRLRSEDVAAAEARTTQAADRLAWLHAAPEPQPAPVTGVSVVAGRAWAAANGVFRITTVPTARTAAAGETGQGPYTPPAARQGHAHGRRRPPG